ncbi:MAG: RNA-binding S4 domain-containing protein [Pseudomonadota bacterium]
MFGALQAQSLSMSAETQRLDQWLWHARFFKTRSLATKLVSGGHVRVDGLRISKPAFALKPGVTLTFPQARRIRVIQVDAVASRRGPASEAQTLYTDLTPPEEERPIEAQIERTGRPSRKDRRNARLSKRRLLE